MAEAETVDAMRLTHGGDRSTRVLTWVRPTSMTRLSRAVTTVRPRAVTTVRPSDKAAVSQKVDAAGATGAADARGHD